MLKCALNLPLIGIDKTVRELVSLNTLYKMTEWTKTIERAQLIFDNTPMLDEHFPNTVWAKGILTKEYKNRPKIDGVRPEEYVKALDAWIWSRNRIALKIRNKVELFESQTKLKGKEINQEKKEFIDTRKLRIKVDNTDEYCEVVVPRKPQKRPKRNIIDADPPDIPTRSHKRVMICSSLSANDFAEFSSPPGTPQPNPRKRQPEVGPISDCESSPIRPAPKRARLQSSAASERFGDPLG